jgi:hypothetical protein
LLHPTPKLGSRESSRDRSDSQGIQRWPPPGDSEVAGGSSRVVLSLLLLLPLPRLSPGLPEGAVSITLPEPRTSFTQRHKIRPTCGLAKDDWTTTLQIEIFSSAVKPVMIICFPKPHSPLNSRIIRVLQTVTQDWKFATRPSCQRMLLY